MSKKEDILNKLPVLCECGLTLGMKGRIFRENVLKAVFEIGVKGLRLVDVPDVEGKFVKCPDCEAIVRIDS